MSRPEVRAAGVVAWRDGSDGVEVLLVHRPKYDDWTFPKGKCDKGEGDEACALRELEEETGLAGDLGVELARTDYRDARRRSKRVRYWALVPTSGEFADNDEVDKVRWVSPDKAAKRLSYKRDIPVLRSFVGHLAAGTLGSKPS